MASTSPLSSSEAAAAATAPRRLLLHYARALAWGGGAVLALLLALDRRWTGAWVMLLVLAAGVVALRMAPVRLSKFSYLTQVGVPALVGILVAPPATALLAVWAGTMVSDGLVLRKALTAALVNAGREVLALAAAAGFLYLAAAGAPGGEVTVDLLPAGVALLVAYFAASRGLFYFSLLLREKLPLQERLFILRWEVLGYLVTVLAAGLVLWAVHTLAPVGWIAALAALGMVGLLARTITEEAIAAEDLNKVHLMQAALTGNVSLHTALEQIEQEAHRLVDWDDLRVHRAGEGGAALVYRSRIGRPGRGDPDPALAGPRAQVLGDGRTAVFADAPAEAGVAMTDPPVHSVVIHPLKFSDRTIGTLEVEHRKVRFYRARDLNALVAIGNQVATAIHIAELRRPLLDTVEEIGGQVQALGRAADSLGGSARALAAASESLHRRAAQQEAFAQAGLEATAALARAAATTATLGSRASAGSRAAGAAAARHREAVGEAIGRLVEVQGFVRASAGHVGALGEAAGRMGALIGEIREVAELTRLIAVNASLEAGRGAGQARTFGVVAEEIQRLAGRTDQTALHASALAADIGAGVQAVLEQMAQGQTLVAGVGGLSDEAARALDAIVAGAREAGEQAATIADAAAAAEDASHDLAGQLRRLADGAGQTRGDVELLASQASAATRGQADLGEATLHLERVAADLRRIARHFVVGA